VRDIKLAIYEASRAYHDSTRWSGEPDDGPTYMEEINSAIDEHKHRIAELETALAWYGEQARLCRLIHSEGDAGRNALADDGGKRARDVLER